MTVTFDDSMMTMAEKRQVMRSETIFTTKKGDSVRVSKGMGRRPDRPDASAGTLSCKVSNVAEPAETSKKSDVGNRLFAMYHKHIGATEDDIIIAVLWTLHTWVYPLLYTTPRLLVTSILPGAGKTTLLDWIRHFCDNAVNMAAISSASLLASLAESGHVMLMDEADRSLRRDNPLTADFLSIVNSGYKKGASRPVQVQIKEGNWEAVLKSTFAPVAFAGNNPDLPEDTEQRCIRLFLFPDDDVEESDWETIEESKEYRTLLTDIEQWANDQATLALLRNRPELGADVRGRFKEIWLPLARTAQTLAPLPDGTSWLDHVMTLAEAFVEQSRIDQEEGLRKTSPHAALLRDIAYLWATEWQQRGFIPSQELCDRLAQYDPGAWGKGNTNYPTAITPRRLATMLRKTGVIVSRDKGNTKRGYYLASFTHTWDTLHVFKTLRDSNRITDSHMKWADGLDA
ncbi:DUF3631 domain-containing protein [Bifidobacterium callimiconis]|uniref:DUF3631 domain-containing protein n=1 Tax=Bifidobacterium callimiconis TaxID=2306973 RepID=UPI001BDBDFED|nr:DUF3631 domain-containing protein [Bifidobacterium callimiconis]MBT1177593.1 DUF3631 domain-containing protein [Bifidobacterium callimiconis]